MMYIINLYVVADEKIVVFLLLLLRLLLFRDYGIWNFIIFNILQVERHPP